MIVNQLRCQPNPPLVKLLEVAAARLVLAGAKPDRVAQDLMSLVVVLIDTDELRIVLDDEGWRAALRADLQQIATWAYHEATRNEPGDIIRLGKLEQAG
jgi:hypothetical protein